MTVTVDGRAMVTGTWTVGETATAIAMTETATMREAEVGRGSAERNGNGNGRTATRSVGVGVGSRTGTGIATDENGERTGSREVFLGLRLSVRDRVTTYAATS